MIFLPTFDNVRVKQIKGIRLDPLEYFIYSNEPADEQQARIFREDLLSVLNYFTEESI